MASRELSKFEQDTLIEALTQIDSAKKAQKIAEYAAAIETERAGRIAAEAKVGELVAEMQKRGDAYRVALADADVRLMQEREGRHTADMLAAQARAEADIATAEVAAIGGKMQELLDKLDELATMEHAEVTTEAKDDTPISYRINVVGRDAAGDLRTLEIVPVERK